MPGTFAPTDDWLYRHIVEDSPVCRDLRMRQACTTWSKVRKEIFGWAAEEALDNGWPASRKIPRQARDWKIIAGVEE